MPADVSFLLMATSYNKQAITANFVFGFFNLFEKCHL